MRDKPDCENCKAIWEKKKLPPPCMDCIPFLNENNEEAVSVYTMVANQVITAGMGTVIDIDFKAIDFIMNLYDVKNRKVCFEKVVMLFRHFLEESKKENE